MAYDFKAPATITVNELADLLHIGRNSAYRLVTDGKIGSIRVGRKILIPFAAFESFLGAYNH